jgi:hypothetical protein
MLALPSKRPAQAYLGWDSPYISFPQKRHPADMGAAEVTAFPRPGRPRAARRWVDLPAALGAQVPGRGEWGRQWVSPATRSSWAAPPATDAGTVRSPADRMVVT